MKLLLIPIIGLSLFACNQQAKETKSCCHHKAETTISCKSTYIDSLKTEIMAIHDEVMPQTSHLMKLRSSLKNEITKNSEKTSSFQPTVDSLKLAHDKMMSWMKGYSPSHDKTDTTYFLKQKEAVIIVNQLYTKTILAAEQKLK